MKDHRIAQPQTGAAVSVDLQKLHAGNRFRLMFGLPLLPEPQCPAPPAKK